MSDKTQSSPGHDHPDGDFADRLTDGLFRSLLSMARALPYRWRVPAFGALNRRLVAPLAGYRPRALTNLDYIWPELSPAEARKIADQSIDNFGRMLIENYSSKDFLAQLAKVTPEGPGMQALEAARVEGRAVILVSGHFGNFQAVRACLKAHGHEAGGLYRPMSNPYVNAHYVKTVEAVGMPVFEQGRRGVAQLLKHLSKGGLAALLNDVYVGSGAELPFLGKPALTATSAAEMALRHNAVLIPAYGIRQPDGISFRIVLEQEVSHSDAVEMTAKLNQSLDARVRAMPGQWFWLHRRWKLRYGDPRAEAADAHPATRQGG